MWLSQLQRAPDYQRHRGLDWSTLWLRPKPRLVAQSGQESSRSEPFDPKGVVADNVRLDRRGGCRMWDDRRTKLGGGWNLEFERVFIYCVF